MFQWSTNRRGTAVDYPGQRTAAIAGTIRPPDFSRSQHLESYLEDPQLKRSTRRSPNGIATHDTVFQTVKGETLILRVSLEDERLPVMNLFGVQARHPWLDASMRVVEYPPIKSEASWRDSRMLLGNAVHQVVQEFQIRPPEIVRFLDPNLQSIQRSSTASRSAPTTTTTTAEMATPHRSHGRSVSNTSTSTMHASSASLSTSAHTDAPPGYHELLATPSLEMPIIPTQFDELRDLDREALDRLLEDTLEFQAFCNRLPVSKTLKTMATTILNDNVKAAEDNLKREAELKSLFSKAQELQKQLKQIVQEFQTLEAKQDKLCRPPDRRKVIRELAKAKKEAFDQSEQMSELWLENGATDVDRFVRDFLSLRKIHHKRAAKLELLELMGSK